LSSDTTGLYLKDTTPEIEPLESLADLRNPVKTDSSVTLFVPIERHGKGTITQLIKIRVDTTGVGKGSPSSSTTVNQAVCVAENLGTTVLYEDDSPKKYANYPICAHKKFFNIPPFNKMPRLKSHFNWVESPEINMNMLQRSIKHVHKIDRLMIEFAQLEANSVYKAHFENNSVVLQGLSGFECVANKHQFALLLTRCVIVLIHPYEIPFEKSPKIIPTSWADILFDALTSITTVVSLELVDSTKRVPLTMHEELVQQALKEGYMGSQEISEYITRFQGKELSPQEVLEIMMKMSVEKYT
jgi:hypothetical protein